MCRLLLILLNEVCGFVQDVAIFWDEEVSIPLMNLELLSIRNMSERGSEAFPLKLQDFSSKTTNATPTYFKGINKLNFSGQQQLVLQLRMDHVQRVAHRVVIYI